MTALFASFVVLLIPATIVTTFVHLVTEGTPRAHWVLYSLAFWFLLSILLASSI